MVEYTPTERRSDLPSYSVDTLEICERFDRAGFEKRFGAQPPPFNINEPPKSWFDTGEKAGNYVRIHRDATGKPSLIPMTMTRELAASFNLPGAYRWPKWVPQPTPATQEFMVGDHKQVIAYPAARLSSEEQARALAIELGGRFQIEQSSQMAPFDVHYHGDPRRVYEVVLPGDWAINAGQLLAQKHVNGIGAPGRWSRDPNGGVYWEPAPQHTAPLDPKVQEIPVPCRKLDADEEFYQGAMGLWAIRKKPAAPTTLDDIKQLLLLLLERLGIRP